MNKVDEEKFFEYDSVKYYYLDEIPEYEKEGGKIKWAVVKVIGPDNIIYNARYDMDKDENMNRTPEELDHWFHADATPKFKGSLYPK